MLRTYRTRRRFDHREVDAEFAIAAPFAATVAN
jgi:hypothetical protein